MHDSYPWIDKINKYIKKFFCSSPSWEEGEVKYRSQKKKKKKTDKMLVLMVSIFWLGRQSTSIQHARWWQCTGLNVVRKGHRKCQRLDTVILKGFSRHGLTVTVAFEKIMKVVWTSGVRTSGVRTFFSISCKTDLCDANSLSLCLPEYIFYLHFWRITLLDTEFQSDIFFQQFECTVPLPLGLHSFWKFVFLLKLSGFSLSLSLFNSWVLCVYVDLFIFILLWVCCTFSIYRLIFLIKIGPFSAITYLNSLLSPSLSSPYWIPNVCIVYVDHISLVSEALFIFLLFFSYLFK